MIDPVLRTDETERELRHSEQRYRLLSEHASDVIWTMTPDGRITSLSASVEKARGFTVEEAMNQPLEEILAPASQGEVVRYFEALHRAMAEGRQPEPYRGEQQYLRKDGSIFWADVIACPITDAEGRVVEILGVSRDISQRVAQRQHLERLVQARTLELSLAKEAAESADRAKSEFLANVGHELRTPLNAIQGFTELALHAATDPGQQEDLRTVLQASRRLSELINAMLDLARLESGRITLDPAEFTLGAVMSALGALMEPLSQDKGLPLICSIDPAAATRRVIGDERRLSLVLVNLVSNAIKFTHAGSVTVNAELGPMADGRQRARFEVIDTGIGIAPQDRERIFRVFEQADASSSRRYEGTGLGLPISRRLAEAMDGSLTVSSEPGRGSTFTLTVPREPVVPTGGMPSEAEVDAVPARNVTSAPRATAVSRETDTDAPTLEAGPPPWLTPEAREWLHALIAHLETGDPVARQWSDQAPAALAQAMAQELHQLRRRLRVFDFDGGLEIARDLQERLAAMDMNR